MSYSIPNLRCVPPPAMRVRALAKVALIEKGLTATASFDRYRYAPADYIRDHFGWSPWNGSEAQPGQQQILDAYVLAIRQQLERRKYEHGETYDASIWQPGQVIKNRIRVEAGHTVGKTKIASGMVSHFLDCFAPSIIYTFAPTWDQVKKLLWKEIKTDRKRAQLPGRILETCEILVADNHFAQGKSTSDAGGRGTERTQGQHGPFLFFLLDEAEGIADFVFDAIESMASGGVVIVVMMANPRTRTSRFHKQAALRTVVNLRMSCLWHPNVVENREIIPGAVRRDYIDTMLEQHAELVSAHNADDHTFELPWQTGSIYKPDREFLFRVLGIAPANSTSNTFVPSGRYDAAKRRVIAGRTDDFFKARIGVDVARFGDDSGTVYVRSNQQLWRAAVLENADTLAYVNAVKAAAFTLPVDVWSLHIRVDGTGGYGSGIIDRLRIDPDLRRRFRDLQIIEVQFGGKAMQAGMYADCVTELYGETAEVLKDVALVSPPDALEADVTERRYTYEARGSREVKKLEPKDIFKKRNQGRSPDDGDGCVLAAAPDVCFGAGRRATQSNWMDT